MSCGCGCGGAAVFMITKTFTPRKGVKVFVKPESSPVMGKLLVLVSEGVLRFAR